MNSKLLELTQSHKIQKISVEKEIIDVVVKLDDDNWNTEIFEIKTFKKIERKAKKDEAYQYINDNGEEIVVEKFLKNDFELYNEIVMNVEKNLKIWKKSSVEEGRMLKERQEFRDKTSKKLERSMKNISKKMKEDEKFSKEYVEMTQLVETKNV